MQLPGAAASGRFDREVEIGVPDQLTDRNIPDTYKRHPIYNWKMMCCEDTFKKISSFEKNSMVRISDNK